MHMKPARLRAGDRGGPVAAVSNTKLDQFAISGPGLWMLVREPQERESNKRHYYVDWQNQSHVSRRKIVRRDHLINGEPRNGEPGSEMGNQGQSQVLTPLI